mgnify:CR=1 FL=1
MVDLLISTLESVGYPVYRQGSFQENEAYPDHFFTFWNVDSTDGSHYDNEAMSCVWRFAVYVYSIDPDKMYTLLNEAITKLKAAHFIVPGKGFDVQTDEPTHTGRCIYVLFLEIN